MLGFFEFELRGPSGLLSRLFRLNAIEAIRCSLAFLEAFVSRANRGVRSHDVGTVLEVDGGFRTSVREGRV